MMRCFALCMAVVLVSSCSTWQRQPVERDPHPVPERYSSDAGDTELPGHWWTVFDSTELNALQARAFQGNLTLAQARARLKQAETAVVSTRAQQAVELSGEARVNQGYQKVRIPSGGYDEGHTENFSIGLAASYEVDFWGRLAAEEQVDIMNRNAAVADVNTAMISVSAEICNRWLAIRYQNSQLALLKKQLANNESLLKLLDYRFTQGKATALAVLQQRQIVARAKSQIPPVQQQLEILKRELNLLLGEYPGTPLTITEEGLPEIPKLPSAGVPSDLLENRPDIQAAWLRLRGSDWDVAAAEANRLPALRLTGSLTNSSSDIDRLFSNWIVNLAASLTAPILDGGRRKAAVDRQKAVADERLAAYKLAVLTAAKEVDSILAQEHTLQQSLQLTQEELEAARLSKQETESRYLNGAETFLNVLVATTTMQSLERSVLQAKNQVLTARITMCRALGGRWSSATQAHHGDNDDGKK